LSGIGFGSLLAFFAFIGFEDLANGLEEAKVPHRDIPRAMVLTLGILYVLVAAVAVSAVSVKRLSTSPAPLSLVLRPVAGVGQRASCRSNLACDACGVRAGQSGPRLRYQGVRSDNPRVSVPICIPAFGL
jgi:hypothetical protein